jgi:HEAT repeat protein
MRWFPALALVSILACHRGEPIVDGAPLSHWEHEAKQVSFFTFWNSDKDERRHVAFRKLTDAGEPAVPTLMRLLGRNNLSVSGDALNAMCALGPKASSAVPGLVTMLASDDPERRRTAASALGCIGPAASPGIPALAASLHSTDRKLVRVAARTLARIGGDAHESLVAALENSPSDVRESALMGVAHAGMDTVRALEFARKGFADRSPAVRARGVEMLISQRSMASGEHVDLLLEAMRDSSVVVRRAADGVYTYFAQREWAPRLLATVLKRGDAGSRTDAAWRLSLMLDDPVDRSRLSPEDFERVHNALAAARHDSVQAVRIYVVRGLAAAGRLPKAMLILRLRQEIPNAPTDLQVRGAAVLWNLTHRVDDVRNAYLAGLRSDDRWLRMEALREIMNMRSAAKPLASAVEKLRDDPDRDVRERAARTLVSIRGTPQSTEKKQSN